MVLTRMGAGYERVEPFNPMHEAILHQKIERAISYRRL